MYVDANGNQFPSYQAACDHYGADGPDQLAAEDAYDRAREAERRAKLPLFARPLLPSQWEENDAKFYLYDGRGETPVLIGKLSQREKNDGSWGPFVFVPVPELQAGPAGLSVVPVGAHLPVALALVRGAFEAFLEAKAEEAEFEDVQNAGERPGYPPTE